MFTRDIDTGKQCLQGTLTQENNLYKGYRHRKTMFTRTLFTSNINTDKQCLQLIFAQINNDYQGHRH